MYNKKSIIFQLTICLGYFVLFWDLALFSEYTTKDNLLVLCLKTLVINSAFLACYLYVIYSYREKLRSFQWIKFIKENKFFLIFMLIFVVSLFSMLDIWLMGDGAIYYSQIKINRYWNLESIFDLKLAGHQTCLYTIWLLIGEYILPDNAVGVRLILIFLATITVSMYYIIMRKMYINSDKINVILFTAIFAFYPAFWGIMGEINTDFPVLIFFIWTIYFQLNKQYLLMLFSALMLCFSKETGVIILAFYAIGYIIVKFVNSIKAGIKETLKQIFSPEAVAIYLAGVSWFVIWLVSSRGKLWSGASGNVATTNSQINGMKLDTFGGCAEYIFHKLKEIFILNNSYILWIFVLAAILLTVFTKKKNSITRGNGHIIAGIYIAFIGLLNFNVYFVTWPNYRYLIPMTFFVNFFASFFVLGYIQNKNIQRVIVVVTLILIFSSNFHTDIISKKMFDNISMGNGDMISTNLFYIKDLDNKILSRDSEITYEYAYDDEGVYNREYSNRGRCINKILKEIKYDSQTLVVFPYIVGAKSFYYGRREQFEYETKYVNVETYKLNMNILDFEYPYAKKWIKLNDLYLKAGEELPKGVLSQYERVFYVYPTIDGKNQIDVSGQIGDFKVKRDFEVKKSTTGFKVLQLK